jgi:hypothetical protein
MKQWLAYLCILLFSLQVMPIKEIGAVLMKGQITEEESCCGADAAEDGPSKLKKHSADPIWANHGEQSNARLQFLTRLVRIALSHASCRSQDFTADILTPPPERL